jgi:hypothetical protein
MAQALERALAKSPGERFTSARAFREAFVDGPVASAPELGDYVASWCGQALAVFTHPTSGGSVEAHTASLGPEDDDAPLVPSGRRWWLLAAAAMGLVVLGGLGWWLLQPASVSDEAATSAVPDASAAELPSSVEGAAAPSEPGAVTERADAATLEVGPSPEEHRADLRGPSGTQEDEARIDSEAPPRRAELSRSPGKPTEGTPGHLRTVSRQRLAQPGGSSERRRADPSTAGPPVVAPVRLGYLTADARPWAAVLLDGREVERTPVSRFPIPAGRHQLVLRGPQGEVDARSIVVEEGQVVTVRAEF